MAGIRVHVVMPAELVTRVDAARGETVSRGEFVRRAVEQALSAGPVGGPAIDRKSPVDSAAARSAAPAEQPPSVDDLRAVAFVRDHPPMSAEELRRFGARSSSFAKRDVRPVPKKGGG